MIARDGEHHRLRAELAEVRQQLAGMRVRAPRAATVVSRGISSLLGSHVEQGAALVVLGSNDEKELLVSVAAIDQDCSSFMTLPSMGSLYIWTRQSPPTPVRAPIWWLVLDAGQQEQLVQRLQSAPRLCVVENTQAIQMRSMGRPVPSTPLVDFIGRSFVSEGTYGDYVLLVRSP